MTTEFILLHCFFSYLLLIAEVSTPGICCQGLSITRRRLFALGTLQLNQPIAFHVLLHCKFTLEHFPHSSLSLSGKRGTGEAPVIGPLFATWETLKICKCYLSLKIDLIYILIHNCKCNNYMYYSFLLLCVKEFIEHTLGTIYSTMLEWLSKHQDVYECIYILMWVKKIVITSVNIFKSIISD